MINTDYCKSCSEFELVKLISLNDDQYCSWECFVDENDWINEIENIIKLIYEQQRIEFNNIKSCLKSDDIKQQEICDLAFDIYDDNIKGLEFYSYEIRTFIENF